MPQIGFTKKQSTVYHRFNALRRAYEDANGRVRIYNPDFLTVLMDAWEKVLNVKVLTYSEDMELYEFVKMVTSAALKDIASNYQPVRIKDSDNRYINNATVATSNLFMTDKQSEAMVFDSHEQAKAFLRNCGHEVGNWIIESVNESI